MKTVSISDRVTDVVRITFAVGVLGVIGVMVLVAAVIGSIGEVMNHSKH